VIASDGIVTLSGCVPSYAQKHAAESAAKRVYGVRGVAADIEVKISNQDQRSDADIARTAVNAMEWDSMVPDRNVKVTVDKGWLTLGV
jgi:osmotically-inducible protein OsmY